MTEAFCAELSMALGAVTILSSHTFSFEGESPIHAAAQDAAFPLGTPPLTGPDDLLARAVQNTLYDRCYARRVVSPPTVAVEDRAADAALVQNLAEANCGVERWEGGWIIQQFTQNGQVLVKKGERERAAAPGAFISTIGPGMAPQPGSAVLLRVPSGALGVQPGYYFAFGETLDELADQLSLMRFYFNCTADGAVQLVRTLTQSLNRFQVPFQLKTPVQHALYGRTDAMVLYVGTRYFSITARIVESLRETFSLAASTPLFAKRLWPGIAVAADPGNGESFGTHRCRLMAEAIVQTWRKGTQDLPSRLESLKALFASAGLDLCRPWLAPGSIDAFNYPVPASIS
jgi:hypothetical protein